MPSCTPAPIPHELIVAHPGGQGGAFNRGRGIYQREGHLTEGGAFKGERLISMELAEAEAPAGGRDFT